MNKETGIIILLLLIIISLVSTGFITGEIVFFYMYIGSSLISLTIFHYFAMKDIKKKKNKQESLNGKNRES